MKHNLLIICIWGIATVVVFLAGFNQGRSRQKVENKIDNAYVAASSKGLPLVKVFDQTTATDSALYYEFPFGYTIKDFRPRGNTQYLLRIGPFYAQVIIEDVDGEFRKKYRKQVQNILGAPYDFTQSSYYRDSLYLWPIFEDFEDLTGFYDLGEIWFGDNEWYTMSYCSWIRNAAEVDPKNGVEPLYLGWIHLNYFHIPFWRQYHYNKTHGIYKN